jgi:hypothetical protein
LETLTAGERHPEGLFAPLRRQDWKTALTVILHSPHYTKRVDSTDYLPLHVAIRWGAPVEVVTALLEAYPDAATIPTHSYYLPCHYACDYGISSEGMKMLLRCNPDAAGVIGNCGRTPMQFLKTFNWQFFADEKEQVRNDLVQPPSYWNPIGKAKSSRPCSCALWRRLIGGIPCAGQWQGSSLAVISITMIWSRSLSNTYEADYNILELNYEFCKGKDGVKVNIYVCVFRHTMND